jgi:hypothetical protein
MHNSGRPNVSFFEKYPNVPQREGVIVINDDYYIRCRLILDAIAHSIARSINRLYASATEKKRELAVVEE